MSSDYLHGYDADLQFVPDPLSPFNDCYIDILHEFCSSASENQNPVPQSPHLHSPAAAVFPASPPSQELEHLSLRRGAQLQPPSKNAPDCLKGFAGSAQELKPDRGCQRRAGYDSEAVPDGNGGREDNAGKNMQRSYSTNFFNGTRPHLLEPPPRFDLPDISSPERRFFSGQMMRRVCSTGDLQRMKVATANSTSPFMEEASSCRVGRYTAEERRDRIQKYRAKRTQRNFNKTIKYACRKTLADSRPRIRGRFARNDEAGEAPKVSGFARDEHDDHEEQLLFAFHRGGEEFGAAARGGTFMTSYGQTQFQHYGS
ncbi:zinc finger protein CO3-like isoform X2 [Rhodamnia argentea]|uniref:Zinc finger protein CO3-like isoform X2 n=1 Tax=Rhodamnia argentea TaxID=178133 RepID=A0A8B8PUY4_9MYRT|nr:zinc finger protein CO3-like isoform X2 [Rhodamnia argentea]